MDQAWWMLCAMIGCCERWDWTGRDAGSGGGSCGAELVMVWHWIRRATSAYFCVILRYCWLVLGCAAGTVLEVLVLLYWWLRCCDAGAMKDKIGPAVVLDRARYGWWLIVCDAAGLVLVLVIEIGREWCWIRRGEGCVMLRGWVGSLGITTWVESLVIGASSKRYIILTPSSFKCKQQV